LLNNSSFFLSFNGGDVILVDTSGYKPDGATGGCLPGRFDSFPLPPKSFYYKRIINEKSFNFMYW